MKAKTHTKPARRHARSNGANHEITPRSARQSARGAAAMAMDHVVQPAIDAFQQAGHQIEQCVHETTQSMRSTLKEIESQTTKHPIAALSCAIGSGVLLGFWLGRR